MIRRDWPLGITEPERWVLIGQQAHARLSCELAAAWGGQHVPPLVCPPDEADHPLVGVRRELLDAILHHDDGWADWLESPRIDPEHDRPYSFTEMPPAEAQKIWRDSIDACRAIGPLAGWVVASHFSALQAKREGDHSEWDDWLRRIESQRAEWFAEWCSASEYHSQELADQCLAWLQAFDWISLWLCLRGPSLVGDSTPAEPLTVGGGKTGWATVVFTPHAGSPVIRVDPWPLGSPAREVRVATRWHGNATGSRSLGPSESGADELVWRLSQGQVQSI